MSKSKSQKTIDAITGTSKLPSQFDHIDMAYHLRMRAFVGICMPSIFIGLNEHLKMMSLRKSGLAPVMFYLDFTSAAVPLAFGRSLQTDYELKLYRSITDKNNQPAQAGAERLMFVSHTRIKGKQTTHGPEALGFNDGSGAEVEAGSAEIMHVITKPLGAPGERQVVEVPEELRVLKEYSWQKPLPSVEGLSQAPQGYERIDTGIWQDRTDVWGIPNTDINQHVNVLEYIMGGENHFSRQLLAAGLAVEKHHIERARLLFRKPFFPGQVYVLRGQFYQRGQQTQLQAGFHLMEGDKPHVRPSAFIVFDGCIAA